MRDHPPFSCTTFDPAVYARFEEEQAVCTDEFLSAVRAAQRLHVRFRCWVGLSPVCRPNAAQGDTVAHAAENAPASERLLFVAFVLFIYFLPIWWGDPLHILSAFSFLFSVYVTVLRHPNK